MSKPNYVIVAKRAIRLSEKGNRNPTLDELLSILPYEKRPKGSYISSFMREVRKWIEKNHEGMPVCTITQATYEEEYDKDGLQIRDNFIDKPPTDEEAIKCIPRGHHPIAGLHFPTPGEVCYIFTEFILRHSGQSMKTTAIFKRRLNSGIKNGVLTDGVTKEYNELFVENMGDSVKRIIESTVEETLKKVKESKNKEETL